ncbi:hypothetical protein A5320_19275 [Rheinheimera sp. SA_1]|uniref:hypothetical protein n=1 Tax=Rheinheimera sp. SA_1 TaxID=1827365 RepID=UPI0008000A4D|nr:hypothetical protein [Rheinheimera sp. SA_1]OBP13196.1 hypothetical protein A5320_19275 [Rheinheimera sp. SA_1]
MPTQVILALDIFPHNWLKNERNLWIGIQPYINGSPLDVANWMKSGTNIFDASDSQFRIAVPGAINDTAIPVLLPSDVSVKLQLMADDDSVIIERAVDRTAHCLLIQPERLRQLNRFSEERDINESLTGIGEAKSYPRVFATQLLQSLTVKNGIATSADSIDPLTANQLAEHLTLKFELGQTQKYDASCFKNLGKPFDVPVRTNPADMGDDEVLATNTHYLLGQLISLGGNIDQLTRVRTLKIFLNGQECPISDPQGTIGRIFSTISDTYSMGDFSQSLDWSNKLAKRINAKEQGDHFSAERLSPIDRFVWRLGSKEISASTEGSSGHSVRWKALERLDIREKSGVADSLLIDPDLQKINVTPALAIDVKISRYRNTPEVLADSSDRFPINSMVVEIEPTGADRTKFEALMRNQQGLIESAILLSLSVKVKEASNLERNIDYQITPHSYLYAEFPWDTKKVLLAFFDTEKEKSTFGIPNNVTFNFNQFVYQNAVMLLPLKHTFTLQRVGVDPSNSLQHYIDRRDPFGPRWEYWHDGSVPDLPDFDALLCEHLDTKFDQLGCDLGQLIFSVFHNDKYDYELAQSARRLEALIHAQFINIRETDTDDPSTYDFDQVVIEDKTNHNQLNILEHVKDYTISQAGIESKPRTIHRNDGSAIPSIKEVTFQHPSSIKKNLTYAFFGALKDTTSAQQSSVDYSIQRNVIEQIGRTEFSVRDFYLDVYENIGDGRSISFNIEHTYGSCILEQKVDGVPNPIDEPILLATDVAYIDTTQEPVLEPIRLLEVSLEQTNDIETITVHLNKQMLDPAWVDNDVTIARPSESDTRKSLTHIQAWQAFAEMYYAESVSLVAECYTFNAHQSDVATLKNPIQQGLVRKDLQIVGANLALKNMIEKVFLELPNANNGFTIPTRANLSGTFNAIRFRLEVTRPDHFIPTDDVNQWEIHKRLAKLPPESIEHLYSLDGPATVRLTSETIVNQIGHFLNNLKLRIGYIHPRVNDQDKERNQQYSALLGDGQTPQFAVPNNNAWIVPSEIRTEQGEIDLAYCPIGIIPIANDPYLKQNTSVTIRRFYEAIQSVIDFEQYGWFKQDAEGLSKRVAGLLEDKLGTKYLDLVAAAANKFKPIPDPNAAPEDLVSPVRALARESQTPENPLFQAVRRNVSDMLTKQPVLFSSLKALGLVEAISVDGQAIRQDFHNLYLNRNIDEKSQFVEAVFLPEKLVRRSKLRFTFLEQLDDSLYDNGFSFKAFHGETVERVFEQQPVGIDKSEYKIHTKNNKYYVPMGEPLPLHEANVRLASRRPVQNPILGSVRQTQIAEDLSDKYLSLTDTLAARLRIYDVKQSETDLEPQKHSIGLSSGKLDKIIVTAVFKVNGDEESSNLGENDAFINDAFYVLVSDQKPEAELQKIHKVPEKFAELVARLQSDTPLSLPTLAEGKEGASLVDLVFDTENLEYCTGIVSQPPLQRKMPDNNLIQKTFGIQSRGDKLEIVELPNFMTGVPKYPISVYLFKNNAQDTVLWVEAEVPIWQAKYVSLVQSRNQAGKGDLQQKIFAPEFATISQAVGDAVDRITRYAHLRDTFLGVELDNGTKTPMVFVQEVLGQFIDDLNNFFAGKVNILNITIKEDSSSSFPSNTSESHSLQVFNGSFAVKLYQLTEQDWDSENAKIKWFPDLSLVTRWRIDFEWRDPSTNDELLRIEDVPVLLK